MDRDYQPLINALKPSFEKFEGRSPWLYLDNLGHLTIGIGHLVHKKQAPDEELETGVKRLFSYAVLQVRTDPAAARNYLASCQAMPAGKQKPKGSAAVRNRTLNAAVGRLNALDSYKSLVSRIDPTSGTLATVQDDGTVPGVWGYDLPNTDGAESNVAAMVNEARQIEKLPAGWKMPIVFFKCFNSYQLAETAIDKLLEDDIANKIKEVKGEDDFEDFDTFPVPAQVAIIDLAFQYGAAGLASHETFASAAGKAEWAKAAEACPAGVAQAERTKFRKDNLKQAGILAAPAARTPGSPPPRSGPPGR